MTCQFKKIQELINGNPLEMKESFAEEIRNRVAEALAKKMVQNNEEVDLEEAVEVRHDRYLRSHGKKARDTGQSGNWMFTHKSMGDVDYNDEKQVHTARGKFADAKKSAQHWAKKHGHSAVYVMEEVEQIDELMEKTHHAARVGTTTWGVGRTPEEAADAHKIRDELKSQGKHREAGEHAYK